MVQGLTPLRTRLLNGVSLLLGDPSLPPPGLVAYNILMEALYDDPLALNVLLEACQQPHLVLEAFQSLHVLGLRPDVPRHPTHLASAARPRACA